ncbi:MAG: zinc ribbon domain-containing protein [Arenicellales bacterium]|jgi:hypothetical protein|nr:regulator [Acidiferrobacteraceae bacterium]MDP6140946.1 hypothetical protein [Arenicellales bacterium]HCV21136.1 regulator [Gammaproteobacteria bacterium]MDP6313643.1 hypothetical protein [Arenicellales bacterium]MDP6397518.1 hypothetical protein [Arenicellales bacterium]|tara:strand:- start:864 stop:1124 length:261 start_codon:yes stop_codon:yes gene_type:complete
MPTYDYRCQTNDQVVEVSHRMSEVLHSWGELCDRAGIEPGQTPLDSPVNKLATGGNVVQRGALSNPEVPSCAAAGNCCSGAACGLN